MTTFRDSKDQMGFTISNCFVCGEKPSRGGFWMGTGSDVTLCSNDGCIEKALQLILDAMHGSDPDIVKVLQSSSESLPAQAARVDWGRSMDRHKKFMAMAERIYWYKESIRLRDILFEVFPTPSEEPVE